MLHVFDKYCGSSILEISFFVAPTIEFVTDFKSTVNEKSMRNVKALKYSGSGTL